MEKRIQRGARHSNAIKHYQSSYGGQFPFWVAAEVLDFSDVSRLYEGMRSNDQREIAEAMGVHVDLRRN